MNNTLRLTKEFEEVTQSFDGELIKDDLLRWHIALPGPSGSPYQKGTFLLDVAFTKDYPFRPPNILFLTKIYHPNINHKGEICIGILRTWSPTFTVLSVLKEISALLTSPNPDDPLMPEVARLFVTDIEKYKAEAERITLKFAC